MGLERILYRAEVTADGGRDGRAASNDGRLQVALSSPQALGGDGGDGTNPEQLFAAAYAACFIGALNLVASRASIDLPRDLAVTAHVALGPMAERFGLEVALVVRARGINRDLLERLAFHAHQVCPYSNALRGNVEVNLLISGDELARDG